MRGSVIKRGKKSWRLKFDRGVDPATAKRQIQYHTFKGIRRDAQIKLAELIASVAAGSYVEPSKTTVGELVSARINLWESAGSISARTAQRYRELLTHQIVPYLGTKSLQKLRAMDIEQWHSTLRTQRRARGQGGVAPRTIRNAHRVVCKALSDAAKNDLVTKNVCKLEPAPKIADDEIIIVQDVPGLVAALQGSRMHVQGMIALFTGMRLGEVLALRWSRVHLERKVVQVREALEHTKAHGIRTKAPKSKAGVRDITLPDILVAVLRDHRRAQLELRIKLGCGRLPDDALLFANLDGLPISPNSISSAWADYAKSIGMPEVTYHALRHTHASQLIDAGVDIVTISRRLGHAKPDITLRVYSHLFQKDDGKASAAINAAFTS